MNTLRLGLRVLPPLLKEPRTGFVQAAKVILGVASPLFAEQHRLVVGDRNRVSPAVAKLAIDGDAVVVLVGVFLLLWLRMLLLLVVVVAPCSKSDDGSDERWREYDIRRCDSVDAGGLYGGGARGGG